MATLVRILTPGNSNFVTFAQGVLDGADAAPHSATHLTFIDQQTGRKLVIAGTGFEFRDDDPRFGVPANVQVSPADGTVTSITLMAGATRVASITGFSEDLTTVCASLQHGTVQGFFYLLSTLGGDITYRGNNGRDVFPGTYGDDTYDGGPAATRSTARVARTLPHTCPPMPGWSQTCSSREPVPAMPGATPITTSRISAEAISPTA